MPLQTEQGSPARRDRALTWFVPVLVVVVAAIQIGRAHTIDQSSWSGAGFGMFATYDSEQHRFVLLEVERPDGRREVIPAPARRPALEAEVVPTRDALLAVADDAATDIDGRIVRVTAFGIRFASDGAVLGRHRLRSVSVDDR